MSVVLRAAALPSALFYCLIVSGSLLSSLAQAETILKCVDAAGHVTFTQNRCPPELKLESSSEVVNVPPGGGNEVVKMAEPAAPVPAAPADATPPPAAAPTDNSPQAADVGERPAPPEFVPSQSYDYQQNGYGGYPFPWPPNGNGWNPHHPPGNGPRPSPQPPRPRPPFPGPGQGQGPGPGHGPGQGSGQNRPPAAPPPHNAPPAQPPHGSAPQDPRTGG